MTNLEQLQRWVTAHQQKNGLEELALTPARNRDVSVEDAAGVALELLRGWDTGTDATEEP